jgi:glycosyltransferase involved in cell wall biosynthesis
VRVGLDLQLARGTATGIGEYASGLFAALLAENVDVVALRNERFDPWRFDRRLVWDQVLLPLAARRARADLVHCASGTMPLVAPAPLVVTVHDVAWLRVQAHARFYARAYFGAFSLARYRSARRILVDSAFSRAELLAVAPRLDPERIEVVYPGVASDVMSVERARDDDAPFALAVGTVERRKNLETLVRAVAAIPELRLIAVGPFTPYAEVCRRLAGELGVAGRVELRGYVPRAELLALYARATLAAVPSRYEGFGYAAAQALCAGVPLVCSNASSLPEIAGDAAPLLDPDDVRDWTAILRLLLDTRDEREAQARAQRPASIARFAWPQSARAVARAYAAALINQ